MVLQNGLMGGPSDSLMRGAGLD